MDHGPAVKNVTELHKKKEAIDYALLRFLVAHWVYIVYLVLKAS